MPDWRRIELDQATGLYYFGARYYDPRINTWLSPEASPVRRESGAFLVR
ncbi:RHS repeat-associated core domain-containing protein [Sorangium sp. So ce1036]